MDTAIAQGPEPQRNCRLVLEHTYPDGTQSRWFEVNIAAIDNAMEGHPWMRPISPRHVDRLGAHAQGDYLPSLSNIVLRERADGRFDRIDGGASIELARKRGYERILARVLPATYDDAEAALERERLHNARRGFIGLENHLVQATAGYPTERFIDMVANAHDTPIAQPWRRAVAREIQCPGALRLIYSSPHRPREGQQGDLRLWEDPQYRLTMIFDIIVGAWDAPTPEERTQATDARLTQALRALLFTALDILLTRQPANTPVDIAFLRRILSRESNPEALITAGLDHACRERHAISRARALCRTIECRYNDHRGHRPHLGYQWP